MSLKKINQAKCVRAGEWFSTPSYCKSGPALSVQSNEVKSSGKQELLQFYCPRKNQTRYNQYDTYSKKDFEYISSKYSLGYRRQVNIKVVCLKKKKKTTLDAPFRQMCSDTACKRSDGTLNGNVGLDYGFILS